VFLENHQAISRLVSLRTKTSLSDQDYCAASQGSLSD